MRGLFGNFFVCGSCMRIKRQNSMVRRSNERGSLKRRSGRGRHGHCNYGYLHDNHKEYYFDTKGHKGMYRGLYDLNEASVCIAHRTRVQWYNYMNLIIFSARTGLRYLFALRQKPE